MAHIYLTHKNGMRFTIHSMLKVMQDPLLRVLNFSVTREKNALVSLDLDPLAIQCQHGLSEAVSQWPSGGHCRL